MQRFACYSTHVGPLAGCLIWSVLLTQRHMTAAHANLCFALSIAYSIYRKPITLTEAAAVVSFL